MGDVKPLLNEQPGVPLAGGYKDVDYEDYMNQYLNPQSDETTQQSTDNENVFNSKAYRDETEKAISDLKNLSKELPFQSNKIKPVVNNKGTENPVVDKQETPTNPVSKDNLIKIFKDKGYTITPEDKTYLFVGNYSDGMGDYSSQVLMDRKNILIITNTFQQTQNVKPRPNERLKGTAEYLKFTIDLTKSPYRMSVTSTSPQTGQDVKIDTKMMDGNQLSTWLTTNFKPTLRRNKYR